MADISNLSNYLKDVADAIRAKKGTEDAIPAANFDTEIASITTSENLDDVLQEQTELITELEEILKTKAKSSIVPNIFMQETEPETKEGIWLQSNKQVDNYIATDTVIAEPLVTKNAYPTLSSSVNKPRAISVGTDIYCVTGPGVILKLNTLDKTWTTVLDSGLTLSAGGAAMGYKDGIIYIMNNWQITGKVYEYEISSNTIIDSYDITGLPKNYIGSNVQIGDLLYLFNAQSDTIYTYNIVTKECLYKGVLSFTTENNQSTGFSCTDGNDKIYLCSNNSEIYEYDIITGSCNLIIDLNQFELDITDIYININYYRGELFITFYASGIYVCRYNLSNMQHEFIVTPEDSGYLSTACILPMVDNNLILLSTTYFRNLSIVLPFQTFDDKAIVINNGTKYNTQITPSSDMIQGRITNGFDDVYYNTIESGLDDTLPTYYGDGTQWIKFKN